MIFNSLEFFVFLPIVFVLFWLINSKSHKYSMILLFLSSYLFYGWWDWRFLFLIFLSSIIDYFLALRIVNTSNSKHKKYFLYLSLFLNLSLLIYFKYFNFFIDSFNQAFTFLGSKSSIQSLNIILPIGISFYTFQTLSYTIDVYRNKLKPTNNLLYFLTYVSFFPQLVAGPIERAANLLPQFYTPKQFDYHFAVNGLKQILWGLFMKVVIADGCAEYVNLIYSNLDNYNSATAWVGAFLFSFQVYGDFAGYTHIAIGCACLFNFRLMKNFDYPFFSKNMSEFWNRWHISLSSWFKDYIYKPLGGNKYGDFIMIRNLFIVFFVSGFWHGAAWTYILYGIMNFLFIVIQRYSPQLKLNSIILILFNFFIATVLFVMFRAVNLTHAQSIYLKLFKFDMQLIPDVRPSILFILIFYFICSEIYNRNKDFALDQFNTKSKYFNMIYYVLITMLLFIFGSKPQDFIYFQF